MKNTVKSLILILILSLASISLQQSQTVSAQNEEYEKIVLGGEPFGIRMFSDGVLVTCVEKSLYGTDTPSPAYTAGIKKNDIIKEINGIDLCSNEQFSSILQDGNLSEICLTIDRDGETLQINVKPEKDSQGVFRTGMWIKDSAAGIGTVTYYNCEDNSFGALGHGICETETGKLIPLYYGEIVEANINDVTKSENGKVGSLNGYFESSIIGNAYNNTDIGVFGTSETMGEVEYIDIGTKDEVYKGEAEIYCTVAGNEKKAYDIEILRINGNSTQSMIIKITDPELLEITGGIVQGMSGSPIVQDGKLIGAVTHVLVNNVDCGYGVFIEDMIEASD